MKKTNFSDLDNEVTGEEQRSEEIIAELEANPEVEIGERIHNVKVGKNVRNVFSLKLRAEELDEIADAADKTGQSVGAFIREAAVMRARSLETPTTVEDVKRKANDLLQAVNRLPDKTREKTRSRKAS